MKIYTRVVMKWVGDELVTVEEDSYEYDGPVAEAKGGGGGERDLTEEELDILRLQRRGMAAQQDFEGEVAYPMKRGLAQQIKGWGSAANAEQAATRAGADANAAATYQQQALNDELFSMGVNPGDPKFANSKARMGINAAALQAGAMTGARDGRVKEGISMEQSFLTGNPIDSGYAQRAASMATNQGNAVRAGNAADAQGYYNTTMGAGQLASAAANYFYGADGGEVMRNTAHYMVPGIDTDVSGKDTMEALRLEDGGYVHGKKGIFTDYGSMPMPATRSGPVAPKQPTTGDYAMGAGRTAVNNKAVQSMAKPYVEEAMFRTGITNKMPSAWTADMKGVGSTWQEPALSAAPEITAGAEGASAEALAAMSAEEAAAVLAAEQAAAAAAAEAAAATAATTAGTAAAGSAAAGATAGATAGSVVPGIGTLIGAGVGALGAYMLSRKDGGSVTPGSVGQTGEIDGPGGPKDDLIPAMLSDGEYVMPIGAVKYYGLDRLEKMRQKGLEFEKQMGIGKKPLHGRRKGPNQAPMQSMGMRG